VTVYALRSLDADRHGRHGQWPEPGVWTDRVANPAVCVRGWHACPDTAGLLDWLDETVWLAELDGLIVAEFDGPTSGKLAAQRARLVRRLPYEPRVFAADCAERVLPIFEAAYPDDPRLREAIAAARSGDPARVTAAWGAAAVAAEDAAEDAAEAVAQAAAAARTAAWAAAGDAAGAAAGAAAWTAAWAAAGAAVAAAAAGDAAMDAAGDAAGAAAGTAAMVAERAWQAQHLAEMLGVPTDLTGVTP